MKIPEVVVEMPADGGLTGSAGLWVERPGLGVDLAPKALARRRV